MLSRAKPKRCWAPWRSRSEEQTDEELGTEPLRLSDWRGWALLAGCGGSPLPIGAPGAMPHNPAIVQPQSLGPTYKVSGPLLYVASYAETLEPLAIYNAKADDPKPIATISKEIDNSSGLCIDGAGTLYVTNDASPGWVSEYALGHTKPLRVITRGINTPGYCAIDASGNLWVTNLGFNDVAEYLKGIDKA